MGCVFKWGRFSTESQGNEGSTGNVGNVRRPREAYIWPKSKIYPLFSHKQQKKKCDQKEPVKPFHFCNFSNAVSYWKILEISFYWEECGTSKVLFVWSSFGHLCQLLTAGAAKRFVKSPAHSITLNISAIQDQYTFRQLCQQLHVPIRVY